MTNDKERDELLNALAQMSYGIDANVRRSNINEEKMKIVIVGNPVDGFSYYGPYEIKELDHIYPLFEQCGDWWVANIKQAVTEAEL